MKFVVTLQFQVDVPGDDFWQLRRKAVAVCIEHAQRPYIADDYTIERVAYHSCFRTDGPDPTAGED